MAHFALICSIFVIFISIIINYFFRFDLLWLTRLRQKDVENVRSSYEASDVRGSADYSSPPTLKHKKTIFEQMAKSGPVPSGHPSLVGHGSAHGARGGYGPAMRHSAGHGTSGGGGGTSALMSILVPLYSAAIFIFSIYVVIRIYSGRRRLSHRYSRQADHTPTSSRRHTLPESFTHLAQAARDHCREHISHHQQEHTACATPSRSSLAQQLVDSGDKVDDTTNRAEDIICDSRTDLAPECDVSHTSLNNAGYHDNDGYHNNMCYYGNDDCHNNDDNNDDEEEELEVHELCRRLDDTERAMEMIMSELGMAYEKMSGGRTASMSHVSNEQSLADRVSDESNQHYQPATNAESAPGCTDSDHVIDTERCPVTPTQPADVPAVLTCTVPSDGKCGRANSTSNDHADRAVRVTCDSLVCDGGAGDTAAAGEGGASDCAGPTLTCSSLLVQVQCAGAGTPAATREEDPRRSAREEMKNGNGDVIYGDEDADDHMKSQDMAAVSDDLASSTQLQGISAQKFPRDCHDNMHTPDGQMLRTSSIKQDETAPAVWIGTARVQQPQV